MSIDAKLMQAVIGFEGFIPVAVWDYKQWTNGYGTKAHYPHEPITKQTARARLIIELQACQSAVDGFRAQLPDGLRNALTDLTYNVGTGWMHDGLGQAVTSGDTEEIETHLLEYDMSGGRTNRSLEERRKTEVSWI